MTCVILFSTTSKATINLVEELNKSCNADPQPIFYNAFTPARREPETTAGPSTSPIDLTVDCIDVSLMDGLPGLYNTKYRPLHGGEYPFAFSTFAVLDERGTQDRTVVIYSEHVELDEDEEPNGPVTWRSWRVRWSDAYDVVSQLEGGSMEIVECVIYNGSERYTDADGVFNYHRASKEMGYS